MAEEFVQMVTIASSENYVIPKGGIYKIEVFGASGGGGGYVSKNTYYDEDSGEGKEDIATGGGGGGGGAAVSRVKLAKGDTLIVTIGQPGENTEAEVQSSLESYPVLQVTSGSRGGSGQGKTGGNGGTGGVGSGGNLNNYTGNTGTKGTGGNYGFDNTGYDMYGPTVMGGQGGTCPLAGGNKGGIGDGTDWSKPYPKAEIPGKPGFVKLYRANSNPPTKPPSLTVEKTFCSPGDLLILTAEASTDLDGNQLRYIYQIQINGASWKTLDTTNALTYRYRVPFGARALSFRVCATNGMEESDKTYSQNVIVAGTVLSPNAIYGEPIRISSESGMGYLKWKVSNAEPSSPKPGHLWVMSHSVNTQITKVIHVQTDSKTIANAEPNAIYVLTPDKSYPLVEEPVVIEFFSNKKFNQTLKCAYVLVTDDNGAVVEDAVRGIYTGAEWKMWGFIPDIPSEWELYECITANKTWIPPQTGQWYRVHVFGKCGDAWVGGYNGHTHGASGDGGNSGGYACSILLLEDGVACTVNASVTAFGSHLSATSGGNGAYAENSAQNTVVGQGIGGTEHNLNGYVGGRSVANARAGQGGNKGALGGYNGSASLNGSSDPGGGGGGARLPTPYDNFPYVPNDLTAYKGGNGARGSGNWGNPGDSYPTFNPVAPMLYGGGNGGGAPTYGSDGSGGHGKGSAGSPGVIIIEVAKGSQGGTSTMMRQTLPPQEKRIQQIDSGKVIGGEV